MKQLIINADDMGFTEGINRGIIEAHCCGVVTSATILANGQAFDDAVQRASSCPSLDLGVHLCLIHGRPMLSPEEVPSLVNSDGFFSNTLSEFLGKLFRRRINFLQVEAEFREQIRRVIRSGIVPTHLDSHKHTHAHPAIFRIVASLAAELKIAFVRKPFQKRSRFFPPAGISRRNQFMFLKQRTLGEIINTLKPSWHRIARSYPIQTPDSFVGLFETGLINKSLLSELIRAVGAGVTEIMCHPGLYDESLEKAPTRLKQQRMREMEALLDPALWSIIEEKEIELTNYRKVQESVTGKGAS